jgi:hypothetical protein
LEKNLKRFFRGWWSDSGACLTSMRP